MTFGPSANGQALYYTNYSNGGEVRRIEPTVAANRPPTARMTATPTSGEVPLAVSFDGSASSDPDAGDTLTYTWNFGDGSASVDDDRFNDDAHLHRRRLVHEHADSPGQRRCDVARRVGPDRSGQHGAAGDDRLPRRLRSASPSARRSRCMRPPPMPRMVRCRRRA